jgi:DNA-binding NarL/FixJ family response regulator
LYQNTELAGILHVLLLLHTTKKVKLLKKRVTLKLLSGRQEEIVQNFRRNPQIAERLQISLSGIQAH